jgi:ABC-type branched-subunit amino acid transport system permease subunit
VRPGAAIERVLLILVAAVIVAVPWLVPALFNPFWVSVIAEILIWSLFAASVNLLFGYVGLLSFGQALYFGFGMYGVGSGSRSRPAVLAGFRAGHRRCDDNGIHDRDLRSAPDLALFRDHHRCVLANLLFPSADQQMAYGRRRRHQL